MLEKKMGFDCFCKKSTGSVIHKADDNPHENATFLIIFHK